MHITIVTRSLCAGGAERVIAQLLNHWVENQTQCSLILLDKKDRFYPLDSRITVHEIGVVSSNRYVDKIKKYSAVRTLVRSLKPDVVLSMPEEIGIFVIGALMGTKIPVVVSERNNPWTMPNKKVTRALRTLLYPFADGFIFQTEQAASFFSKRIQEKGVVLPNPLDLTRIPAPFVGERQKIIVGAGRLEPQKNFFLLIDAFQQFYREHPEYRLIIYGEGSLRKDLEAYAAEQLPEGTFELPGRASDLVHRLNPATAFVLSSDFEGMPNVLIEAMATGVPCVSTDCPSGGPAELIRHGENGYLVSAGAAEEIAEQLSHIVNTPEEAAKISQRSVAIKNELDATIVASKWKSYLQQVCNTDK